MNAPKIGLWNDPRVHEELSHCDGKTFGDHISHRQSCSTAVARLPFKANVQKIEVDAKTFCH